MDSNTTIVARTKHKLPVRAMILFTCMSAASVSAVQDSDHQPSRAELESARTTPWYQDMVSLIDRQTGWANLSWGAPVSGLAEAHQVGRSGAEYGALGLSLDEPNTEWYWQFPVNQVKRTFMGHAISATYLGFRRDRLVDVVLRFYTFENLGASQIAHGSDALDAYLDLRNASVGFPDAFESTSHLVVDSETTTQQFSVFGKAVSMNARCVTWGAHHRKLTKENSETHETYIEGDLVPQGVAVHYETEVHFQSVVQRDALEQIEHAGKLDDFFGNAPAPVAGASAGTYGAAEAPIANNANTEAGRRMTELAEELGAHFEFEPERRTVFEQTLGTIREAVVQRRLAEAAALMETMTSDLLLAATGCEAHGRMLRLADALPWAGFDLDDMGAFLGTLESADGARRDGNWSREVEALGEAESTARSIVATRRSKVEAAADDLRAKAERLFVEAQKDPEARHTRALAYQRAAALNVMLERPGYVGACLQGQANSVDDRVKSCSLLMEAAIWYRKIDSNSGVGSALYNAGIVTRPDVNPLGDWTKASELYRQAAEAWSMDGANPAHEAECLYWEGRCIQPNVNPAGSWSRAIELHGMSADLYQQSYQLHKEQSDLASYCTSLYQQAWCLVPTNNPGGDWSRAAKLSEQAAAAYENIGHRYDMAMCLQQQAWCLMLSNNSSGDWSRAEQLFEKAGRAFEEEGRGTDQAFVLYNQGCCAQGLGSGARAATLFERAESLFRSVDRQDMIQDCQERRAQCAAKAR